MIKHHDPIAHSNDPIERKFTREELIAANTRFCRAMSAAHPDLAIGAVKPDQDNQP